MQTAELTNWSLEEMRANPEQSLQDSYEQMIAAAQIAAEAPGEETDYRATLAEYAWLNVKLSLFTEVDDDDEAEKYELTDDELLELTQKSEATRRKVIGKRK